MSTHLKLCLEIQSLGGDEVNNLHILRMMAKPYYILACYECVVEATFSENEKKHEEYTCTCPKEDEQTFRQHYCPAHPNFIPYINCHDHVECNDPIFRCFDLSKLSASYAEKVPEFREEYLEISQQCSQLSVGLLEECTVRMYLIFEFFVLHLFNNFQFRIPLRFKLF